MSTTVSARVIADSLSGRGHRLTTLEVTMPRIVLAEFNTHRVFSRNSASSRAIPISKQITRVMEDPFVPTSFPVNQAGMSASEYIGPDSPRYESLCDVWLAARKIAVMHASRLSDMSVHKQIVNRLLEPFMWHTVLVSSTEWDNFFTLRCHPAAQPEIRAVAEQMRDALDASEPVRRAYGEWHLPLLADDERAELSTYEAVAISAARCARVSYDKMHEDEPREKSLARAEMLARSGHWSPWEHPARVIYWGDSDHPHESWQNFRGWGQARWFMEKGEGL